MRTPNKWTILGYIVGAIWSLLFAVRYLVIWVDYSQAIIFVFIGVVICALAFIYDCLVEHKHELDAQGEKIQDLLLSKKDKETENGE